MDKNKIELETEATVLGGIIANPKIAGKISIIVKPENFSNQIYGKTYEVAIELAAKDELDALLLRNELEKSNIDIGGLKGISNLFDLVVSNQQTLVHARKLVEQHQARKLENSCYQAIEQLSDKINPVEVHKKLLKDIDMLKFQSKHEIPTIKQIVDDTSEDAKNNSISTNLLTFDNFFGGGLVKGETYIIGAGTSVGKTTLALNLLLHACFDTPVKALYAVQEMSKKAVQDRLTAIFSRVPLGACKAIRTHKASNSTIKKYLEEYNNSLKRISQMDLRIEANGIISASELTAMVEPLSGELDIVVLDHIQQCKGTRAGQSAKERIDEVSQICKDLAVKHNIVIIILAQLSREGARAGRYGDESRPQLWHIKESGNIENDADNVILLHRKQQIGAKEETLEVNICKNRNGETGRIHYRLLLDCGVVC